MTEHEIALVNEIRDDVKKVWKILSGNGEPGLCEAVRKNTEDIMRIKEDRRNAPKTWRSWFTFGVTILTFVVLVYTVFGR